MNLFSSFFVVWYVQCHIEHYIRTVKTSKTQKHDKIVCITKNISRFPLHALNKFHIIEMKRRFSIFIKY